MKKKFLSNWKRRTNQLKIETYALYLAYKDPRVPWYAKILFVGIIGYAFSPIDKFLSSIPIIGYLDHLFLVPLGVVLVFQKFVPPEVLTGCRNRATRRLKPNWIDHSIIFFIWFLLISLGILSTTWAMRDWHLVIGQWLRWFTRMTSISKPYAR